MTERKCSNWLDSFMMWCLPRSEATETYIYWSGLFTLASTIKRKLFIPKAYMGSYDIYPNLYILFVGDAGKPRKTTTVGYAEDLLDNTPNIHRSTAAMSEEVLMNKLAKSPDGSLTIRSTEFSSLYKTSREKMIEFLVDVYDGKKNHDYETLSRGLDHAENPCINLIAGTTPVWIAENLSEAAMGGGFASRCIFLYSDGPRRRKLYYRDLDHKELDDIRTNLLQDLHHIEKELVGEFFITDEAMDFMEPWYKSYADKRPDDHKLSGYIQRKHVHAHKLALLYHVSYSDDKVLTLSDFMAAIKILETVEKDLPKTFSSLGKNPYTVDMDNIKSYIIGKNRVTHKELLSHFYTAAAPAMLEELVNALVQMGEIELTGDPSNKSSLAYVPVYTNLPIIKQTIEEMIRPKSTGQVVELSDYQEKFPATTDEAPLKESQESELQPE